MATRASVLGARNLAAIVVNTFGFIEQANLVQNGLQRSDTGCVLADNMPSPYMFKVEACLQNPETVKLLTLQVPELRILYCTKGALLHCTSLIGYYTWAHAGNMMIVGSSWQGLLNQHWL